MPIAELIYIVRNDIAIGDVLIGLPSSGVHSNGYSLVRRLVATAKLDWNDPAPWAKGQTMADALIEPTRIYVKPLLAAIRATGGGGAKGAIKALSHITGGGLAENLPRVMPDHAAARIDLASFKMPPVFGWLAKTGHLDDTEMLRTFNCGTGMVIVADKARANDVLSALKDAGEYPVVIGSVVAPSGEKSDAKGKGETWAVQFSGRLSV